MLVFRGGNVRIVLKGYWFSKYSSGFSFYIMLLTVWFWSYLIDLILRFLGFYYLEG